VALPPRAKGVRHERSSVLAMETDDPDHLMTASLQGKLDLHFPGVFLVQPDGKVLRSRRISRSAASPKLGIDPPE
jgi:hypothetical protein